MLSSIDIRGFAVIVFVYALFEFFLKRLWWNVYADPVGRKRYGLRRGITLFALQTVWTSPFLNGQLFAGYVFVAAIYWLYEFSSGKQSEPETQQRSLANFLLKQLLMVALLYTAWQLARPVQTAMWYYTIEERFLAGNGLYGWWQRQMIFSYSISFGSHSSIFFPSRSMM